jgi:hypothetical protein
MGEIVNLKPALEIAYWRCNCGGQTFYVRNDEELECAICAHVVRDCGFWRLPAGVEAPRQVTEDDPPSKRNLDFGDPDAALQSVLRFVDPVGTAAVVVLRENGAVTVWGKKFDTRKRRAWLRRKLDDSRKFLIGAS